MSSKIRKDKSSLYTKNNLLLGSPNSFVSKFNSSCDKSNLERLAIVKLNCKQMTNGWLTETGSVSSDRIISSKPEMIILTDSHQTFLQIILKNCCLTLEYLKALKVSLIPYSSVTVLRLEYCNLTNLDLLKDLLLSNNSLRDLSLNGNSEIREEIFKVIENTNIAILSVAFCNIGDEAISLLSKPIRQSMNLIALNLSSNNITDFGLTHITDALRENRTLKCLNLSDNYISDVGCIDFVKILQKFPLKHEEIVFRRKRTFERLKKISSLIISYKILQATVSMKTSDNSIKKLTKRSISSQISSRKSRHSSKSKDTASTSSSKNVEPSNDGYYERLAVQELGPDVHPFVGDSYPEDKMIYCIGNLTLQYLNLSYNKLKLSCLEHIKNMYEYRKTIKRGTVQIQLDGNPLPSDEVDYVIKLMASVTTTKTSSRSSKSTIARTQSS